MEAITRYVIYAIHNFLLNFKTFHSVIPLAKSNCNLNIFIIFELDL